MISPTAGPSAGVRVLLRVANVGFNTTEVVLAYVLFNTVYTLGSYPAGMLTDRWPRPYVYAVGLLAFAAGYLGLGLVRGARRVCPGGGLRTLPRVHGRRRQGMGVQPRAFPRPRPRPGHLPGSEQGAILVAGLWAGLLWDVGPGAGVLPLLVAGGGGLLGAIVLVVIQRRTRAASA